MFCPEAISVGFRRGAREDADIANRIMFGIFLDVTQRKQAEEANELLAGEMSHRVMNLLHIATALTQITSRSAASKEDMARELTNRLMALGRAQELVRPIVGKEKSRQRFLATSSPFCLRRTTKRKLAFAFVCQCQR